MTVVTTTLATAAMISALAYSVVAQQKNPYRNYTQEKFEENMQAAGRNYAAVASLIGNGDYESAKAQLTRAREQLAITITFWRDRQRDDAVALLRSALNGMDALDAVLGASPVDAGAVRSASQQVDAACSACHATYREQDPVTKAYRLKPGTTPQSIRSVENVAPRAVGLLVYNVAVADRSQVSQEVLCGVRTRW